MTINRVCRILALITAVVSSLGARAAEQKEYEKGHSGSTQNSDHQHFMVERLRAISGKEFEQQFLNDMIQHHKDGVQMAELAVSKAQLPQIKDLAKKNVENQTRESEQMTSWLSEWHQQQPKAPSHDNLVMQKMMKQMEELRAASGSEFDPKFLTSFSDHHKEAIEMGKLTKSKGVRRELQTMVEKMMKQQTSDIQEMQRLRSETAQASK